MKKNILIVGGSSGLGLELAHHYVKEGHHVCITGRHNPDMENLHYIELDVGDNAQALTKRIDHVVDNFPAINTLIYTAGFCQRAHIDVLSDSEIIQMTQVGLLAPMLLVKRLKNGVETPLKVMLVTSSSQYTARELESVYCATKSGLGMFGASLVRDPAIGKVLVVAPSGMKSAFWRGTDVDQSSMLDVRWVADQTVELSSGKFKYKFAKILRDPARVIVEECLDNDLNPLDLH